jgi:hypothetical protein
VYILNFVHPNFKTGDAFGTSGDRGTGVLEDRRKRKFLKSGTSSGGKKQKYTIFLEEIQCLLYLLAWHFRGKLDPVSIEKKGRGDSI